MASSRLPSFFPPSFSPWTKTKAWSSHPFFPFLLLSSLVLLTQLLLLTFLFSRLPPQLPLFYSLPWGPPQLTTPPFLFLLPTLSLTLLLTNSLLAHLIKDNFISHLLWITATLVALMATYTLIHILVLVT